MAVNRLAFVSMLGLLCLSLSSVDAGQSDGELSDVAIQRRILQYRTAQVTLTLAGPDGKPLAGMEVTIRQTRHRFLFGSNAFLINTGEDSQLQRDYQKRFIDLLNFATLPFYWGNFERTEGRPGTQRLDMMARWCAENGIRAKGHPLCWQQVFPRWLMERPLEEIQRLQIARITRDVGQFAGRIDTWDVVNEAVMMPDYRGEPTRIPELCRKTGRLELIRQAFAAARQANPGAVLILNDYDTSARYERLIEECLAAGVPVDVIGIQSHMHAGYWGAARTWDVCQRFGRFGRPLHFTETTIISGERKESQRLPGRPYADWPSTVEGERRQAEQVVEFYTVLFSHPAVQAITWWDLSDQRTWLGAPAGLLRRDMSPKPAYQELLKLIKGKWWTAQVRQTTDNEGRLSFSGFLGDYVAECSQGRAAFRLDSPGRQAMTLSIR